MKPTIAVSARKRLFAGQLAQIDITVSATDETKIKGITARVKGEQGWSVGSGKSRVSASIELPAEMHFDLTGPGVLAVDSETTFTIEVPLPASMPPSHSWSPAHARLELAVHIDIPWKIDVRETFYPEVHHAPPPVVERTPYALRSTDDVEDPRIDIALASLRVIAGEDLQGSVAVFHFDDSKPREITLSLVPQLKLTGRRDRERAGTSIDHEVILPAGGAGRDLPFRIPLSSELTPSFDASTHSLSWLLTARIGSMFRTQLEISVPLEILDASAVDRAEPLAPAPRLGDARIASLFEVFAAQAGWVGANLDVAKDGSTAGRLAIEREIGDSFVRIAYDYRGEDGTFVISTLSHRNLGLGLRVTPGSTMRHLFFKDVEVNRQPWDLEHHVTARDAAQTMPFLRAVVPTLDSSRQLGTLMRWTDDGMQFSLPLTTLDLDALTKIAANLDALVVVVERAAELDIAPPATVTVDKRAWTELAARYATRPLWGDLSIEGKLGQVPVDIEPVWSEAKAIIALRVTYGDPALASDELRAQKIELASPAKEVLARDVAEPLVTLLVGTLLPVHTLRVIDGVASVVLPISQSIDVEDVRATVELLGSVLAALSPGTGPYR